MITAEFLQYLIDRNLKKYNFGLVDIGLTYCLIK